MGLQFRCLSLGEGGPQGRDADVLTPRRQRDGDGVHGPLDEHRRRTRLQISGALGKAEQLLALREGRRPSRVQVLRTGELVVFLRRVTSADEPDQVAAGVDREHEAVPERVHQSAALCLAGEADVDHFLDRRTAGREVLNQAGRSRGCVADLEPLVLGEVGSQPLAEVFRRPRPIEHRGVVVERPLVELDDPGVGRAPTHEPLDRLGRRWLDGNEVRFEGLRLVEGRVRHRRDAPHQGRAQVFRTYVGSAARRRSSDQLLGAPFGGTSMHGGDEGRPHRIRHHPLASSFTKSLTQVPRPGRAERVGLVRRRTEGGGTEVPDDPPPERVRGAFVGERVVDVHSPVDQRADVDPGCLEGAEALGQTGEFNVGPDLVGQEFGQVVVGAVNTEHRLHPAMQVPLVRSRRRTRLHGAGRTTVALGHGEGGSPNREISAKHGVLARGEP